MFVLFTFLAILENINATVLYFATVAKLNKTRWMCTSAGDQFKTLVIDVECHQNNNATVAVEIGPINGRHDDGKS